MGKVKGTMRRMTRSEAELRKGGQRVESTKAGILTTPTTAPITLLSSGKISKKNKKRKGKKKSVTFSPNLLLRTEADDLRRGQILLAAHTADTPTTITTLLKGVKGKKMRRKLKSQLFNKKLERRRDMDEEGRARKAREATTIVGDLQPLSQILEELMPPLTPAPSAPHTPRPLPNTSKFKVKKREAEILDGLKYFQAAGFS